jgi:RNA polymerase sigma-70 factor (ECF subfamily)
LGNISFKVGLKMTIGRADSTLIDQVGADQLSKASGPEEEVIRLFDQLRSPLLRYVFSFGLSLEDSEEVTQEVFLSLFQHLRQGRARHNLRGWIFRVGHNVALKRRAARDARRLEQTGNGAFHQLRDPALDPEAALAARQKQERLLSVFNALPEQDRCCLNLRAEGLRYREIAQVLGISLGSVALSLGRSIERLSRADGSGNNET